MNAQLFTPLEVGRKPFVRVSFDPTVSLKSYLQHANLAGFESSVDTEIKQNLFLTGGFGILNVQQDEPNFQYTSNGMFLSVGADLNLTKYTNPLDRNIFFVGLHYGYAVLTHNASSIVFVDDYWKAAPRSISSESITASWVEVAMGLKVEAVKNIFIGWTGEAKFRSHLSSGEMRPYMVPGLGKTETKFNLGINIFVSYAFTMKPKVSKDLSTEKL